MSATDEQLIDAAARFGTPLFAYDASVVERQVHGLVAALPDQMRVLYSLKANPSMSLVALVYRSGAGAEVCSLAELEIAQRAGVPGAEIIYLGPGKTDEELRAAISVGVRALVIESLSELERASRIAVELGRVQAVLLRVNPELAVSGSRLSMGGKPRQFGIDEAQLRSLDQAPARPGLSLVGIHAYCGTRILDWDIVVRNTAYILNLADALAAQWNIELETVDVGGGLGVPYFDGEEPFELAAFAAALSPIVEDFRHRHPHTQLLLEAGRFLVADAGSYVTRVVDVKESKGRSFAVCDGGTNHHMAAVGIGSFAKRNFPARVASHGGDVEPRRWTVTGPLCTPNDTLLSGVELVGVQEDALVIVERSGAYGPSASPGLFLSHGYPAEVLLIDGETHLIARRDSVSDVLQRQRLVLDAGLCALEPIVVGHNR